MTLTTDVLIAGGGPCGLTLALELGRRGVRTLLVDPKRGTAFNPQANATQARTMEHFRRLGLAQELRAQGLPPDHPTDIAYFTRLTGHELARLPLPTAQEAVRNVKTMAGSWSAAELPHRISQKYVEATLRRHAQAQGSNDIRYGWRLQSFEDRGPSVRAWVQPAAGGQAVEVEAGWLVGADGARSAVRQGLGIAWEGESGVRRDFMGGQMFAVYLRAPAFYDVFAHRRAWMYVSVNHERRAFMASVDGRAEFAFHAAVHPGEDADAWTEADARRVFAQALGRELPIEVLSFGTWTAGPTRVAGHSRGAGRFGRGRVFIGGDAAHLFTPTGGLGYNTAVEDAVNLGWKLAAAVRGQAGPGLLASYEVERRPLAVRNTAYARQFADSVGRFVARPELEQDGAAGDAARREASAHLNAHVRLEFNIPGVTFGGRYDASPLIVPDGTAPPPDTPNTYVPTACPGGRPPHAWLEDGRSLFDSFHGEWTLLALGAAPPATEPFEQAARRLGLDLLVVHHPSEPLRALYEAPLALVRPDQIVAWRGGHGRDAGQVLRVAAGLAADDRHGFASAASAGASPR
jgi:2-polyprenyl-6-methoxyphenol hydroxylase-like FAD-dependent oxidoreductase